MEELAKSTSIKLKTPDGRESASVTVNTDNPFHGRAKTEHVPFIVPEGYVRFSFSSETSENRGTAWVKWVSNDPKDGTIEIHADCLPIGKARAAVSEVYAIPE
jgi:hypothetical protein